MQMKNTTILDNVKKNLPEWNCISSIDDIEITKLNGNSNAVYKLHIPTGKYD